MDTFLTKEEFYKKYSTIKSLWNSTRTLVRIPRSLYIELCKEIGYDEDIQYTRNDIDDNTPIPRCARCGSELMREKYISTNSGGYFDDDGDYNPSNSADDTEHVGYFCHGCDEEISEYDLINTDITGY